MSRYLEDGLGEGTSAYIQWKGTDVCMDFNCECGYRGHFDGYFAYAVRCPDCDVIWEAPVFVSYRKARPEYDAPVVDPE